MKQYGNNNGFALYSILLVMTLATLLLSTVYRSAIFLRQMAENRLCHIQAAYLAHYQLDRFAYLIKNEMNLDFMVSNKDGQLYQEKYLINNHTYLAEVFLKRQKKFFSGSVKLYNEERKVLFAIHDYEF
jgi:hypothetical protein